MPIIRKPTNPDDEQPLLARSGGGAAGPAGPTAPTQSAPPAQAPGNFVNLQSYLQANNGGKGMADQVLGGIGEQAKKASGIGGSVVRGLAPGPISDAQAAGPAVPTKPISPTAGPGGTGYFQQQQMGAAQEAQRMAGLAQTGGGRKELLDQTYGKGRSTGESDLDNALLGNGAGGRLEGLKSRYANLANNLSDRQRVANEAGATSIVAASAAKKAADAERERANAQAVGTSGNRPREDLTYGANASTDPNTLSDQELNAMGFMDSPAPNESYAHYSDRIKNRSRPYG